MSKLLLSINPEYVEKIFSGAKKYEFRKTLCKRPIDGIVFYCTYPVMKVVGEASIIKVIVDEPDKVWKTVKNAAGINKQLFDKYYQGREKAVAYQLGYIDQFIPPRELNEFGIYHAPQSFVYI